MSEGPQPNPHNALVPCTRPKCKRLTFKENAVCSDCDAADAKESKTKPKGSDR